MPELDDLTVRREVAEKAARAAGAAQRRFAGSNVTQEPKGGDPRNLVTVVDREAQAAAVAEIRDTFPDDVIVGEEDSLSDTEISERMSACWLVDGLDGTFAFVREQPFFGTAVGYAVGGRPVAGSVYLTMHDEALSAASGLGATVNGRPLRVSNNRQLSDGLISVMATSRSDADKAKSSRSLRGLLAKSHGVRTFGPPAVALGYLASGRIDAFMTLSDVMNMGPWDLAAATVIVEEAGGVVRDQGGQPVNLLSKQVVAATCPEMLEEILSILEPGDD